MFILKKNNISILSIVEVFVWFCLIYNFNLINSESIRFCSSDTIVITLLIFVSLFLHKKPGFNYKTVTMKVFKVNYIFQIICFFYLLFILCFVGLGKGVLLINSVINYLFFLPILFFLLTKVFYSVENTMKAILWASIIQAIIIGVTLANDSFASMIDNSIFNKNTIVTDNRNYSEMRLAGYPGGISCITSSGSLKLSMGLLACAFFLINKNNISTYVVCYLFITFISSIVSRTGFFVSFIVWITTILYLFKVNLKKACKLAVLNIILLSLVLLLIIQYYEQLILLFYRLFLMMETGVMPFFEKYFCGETTVIPPLCFETLLGTGITSGISGNNIKVIADGNFIRIYSALGLPMAIVFYCVICSSILTLISKIKHKHSDFFAFLFLLVFFIGEFKEPLFYTKYCLLIFFVCMFYFETNVFYMKEKENKID